MVILIFYLVMDVSLQAIKVLIHLSLKLLKLVQRFLFRLSTLILLETRE